jgi:hypothetical protein
MTGATSRLFTHDSLNMAAVGRMPRLRIETIGTI